MKTLLKWTIDDYHKIIQSDILTGRNCELIDGEIIEMSPELPNGIRIDLCNTILLLK
ncbi:hypothetical protein [Dolichospermum sp. UHCC 0259]|uniref:hypothetical protein n=1 Tax=Dolichospermum sp. UHCC 0259 TaxID=2590010 RepID=UPI00144506A4|nr:hypothetical protein [Dolichospermum sp. UHCC 0259]